MLLVVSMDHHGEFVDGDVNARVRDRSKGGRVMVWVMGDGGVEGDTGGRGDVKRSRGGRRSGATLERTGSQPKEDGKAGMGLGRQGRKMGRNRDVFCADSVTAEESDRSCQGRVRRTERTAEEREEERGHDMGGRGGVPEETSDNNIIVNGGDMVLRYNRSTLSLSRQSRRAGQAGHSRAETGSGSCLDRKEEIDDLQPHSTWTMSFDHSLRLLLPTVRTPRTLSLPPPPPKSPKIKSSASRSSRTRLVLPQPPQDPQDPSLTTGQLWLGKNSNFEIVQDQLQLEGFQLFAVEKWLVLLSSYLPCPL